MSVEQKASIVIFTVGWIGLDGITGGMAQEVSSDIDTLIWTGNFAYDYQTWISQYAVYDNAPT